MRLASSFEANEKTYAVQAIIEARVAVGDFVEALETVAAIGDVGERLNALTAVNLSGRNIEPEVYGRILRMIDADQLNLFGTGAFDITTDVLDGLRIDALLGMALAQTATNDRVAR